MGLMLWGAGMGHGQVMDSLCIIWIAALYNTTICRGFWLVGGMAVCKCGCKSQTFQEAKVLMKPEEKRFADRISSLPLQKDM